MKAYTEYEVLKTLSQKKSLKINENNRSISINEPKNEQLSDLGICAKGKMDYLKHFTPWTIIGNYR